MRVLLFEAGGLKAELLATKTQERWEGPILSETLLVPLSGSALVQAGASTYTASPRSVVKIPRGYPDTVEIIPQGPFFAGMVVSAPRW